MDIDTWNKLTSDEQEEIKFLGKDFIMHVLNSNASDGIDFWMKYEVRNEQEFYYVFEKSSNKKLCDIRSKSEKVMKALMTDATQNFGR